MLLFDDLEAMGSNFGSFLASFWALFSLSGTDPEDYGADPEDYGPLLLCPPTKRGKSATLFGIIFEVLAAAAPKKRIKSAPWEKHQKMRGKILKKCSFPEGLTCDPYTPAQSKHTFSCLIFWEKQPPNDIKKLPQIETNPWKSDAWIARSRFLRGLERGDFSGRGERGWES